MIPPLPWAFDFNKITLAEDQKTKRVEGEPPLTWVGARYRHKVRDVDGERVMVKVTYIPKGTRSQLWIGHPDLHDYTIQADLKGGDREDNQMPDMGVIAQRYTLDMMGQSQKLQIRTWPPQVATHLGKKEPFEWKADVWYTVKFRATDAGERRRAAQCSCRERSGRAARRSRRAGRSRRWTRRRTWLAARAFMAMRPTPKFTSTTCA